MNTRTYPDYPEWTQTHLHDSLSLQRMNLLPLLTKFYLGRWESPTHGPKAGEPFKGSRIWDGTTQGRKVGHMSIICTKDFPFTREGGVRGWYGKLEEEGLVRGFLFYKNCFSYRPVRCWLYWTSFLLEVVQKEQCCVTRLSNHIGIFSRLYR